MYVLFTSGSTGTPKGVCITHRNLANYTNFIQNRLGLSSFAEGLHFATVSTLSADLGNTSIFPALASGGCVHVVTYDVATDAQRFGEYCTRYPIDVLKIVPSHLEALLSTGDGRAILPRKFLILGGEALMPSLVEQIESLGAECVISNHYGPTETTVESVVLRVGDFDLKERWAPSIPIGKPVDNTKIYILDSQQHPVPIGVTGELYIGGEGVARGYLDQPELTAQRFVADPFQTKGRMYRTGDLARYLPDGTVEFLGRNDDQVKVRGFRVELGEIESAMKAHAGVQQAVVVLRAEAPGEARLAAYFVPRREGGADAAALRSLLEARLPDYMVPSFLVPLAKIPLNANGKLDRRGLPAPEAQAAKQGDAPATPTQIAIARIWSELFKRDEIRLDEDFFELGGHSLTAIQLISRIRQRLGQTLDVQIVFDTPTVRGLAAKVDSLPPSDLPPEPTITRQARAKPARANV